jgi:hypothetical protein
MSRTSYVVSGSKPKTGASTSALAGTTAGVTLSTSVPATAYRTATLSAKRTRAVSTALSTLPAGLVAATDSNAGARGQAGPVGSPPHAARTKTAAIGEREPGATRVDLRTGTRRGTRCPRGW